MRYYLRRSLSLILALIMVTVSAIGVSAVTRDTDTTTPGNRNVIVSIPGEFEKANVSEILALVNSYRKEACQKGYYNPDNYPARLTPSDYHPVKWSGDLEWIAQTRAAEGAVYQSHNRPNGSLFDCSHNGVYSEGETLAWNYGSLIGGIEQWYEEKEDWINNTDAETGHYTAMISPSTAAIGIGCFTSNSGDWSCVAGQYSSDSNLSEAPQGVYGKCEQKMEVEKHSLSAAVIKGKSIATIGKNYTYKVEQHVSYPHIWSGNVETPVSVNISSWSSSNTGVASIDSSGNLKASKIGNTTIKANLSTGTVVSLKLRITHPAKGVSITVGKNKYKVTKTGSEVAYTGKEGAKGKVTIPATATYYGKKYKVTSIAASAFKGNKNITSVVIGKNVKSIGKFAFNKCKKLKKVTIKTKKLTAAKVGKKAFSGSAVKSVKCPAGKKAAYKKILTKKGIKKSAKFN